MIIHDRGIVLRVAGNRDEVDARLAGLDVAQLIGDQEQLPAGCRRASAQQHIKRLVALEQAEHGARQIGLASSSCCPGLCPLRHERRQQAG